MSKVTNRPAARAKKMKPKPPSIQYKIATSDILNTIHKWKHHREERIHAEREEEKLGNALRAFIGETSEAIAMPASLTLLVTNKFHTKTVFDEEAFKRRHPKMHARFMREVEYRRLIPVPASIPTP